MLEIFSDSSYRTYKTERFCNIADQNVILSVEMCSDGSEKRICQNLNICKNKDKCRYLCKQINQNNIETNTIQLNPI